MNGPKSKCTQLSFHEEAPLSYDWVLLYRLYEGESELRNMKKCSKLNQKKIDKKF